MLLKNSLSVFLIISNFGNKETLKEIEDIEKLQYADINVLDYSAYPTLKVAMVS